MHGTMNVKKRNISFIERFILVHLPILSSFVVGKFHMKGNFTLKFYTKRNFTLKFNMKGNFTLKFNMMGNFILNFI
jgi:hypothetical protein